MADEQPTLLDRIRQHMIDEAIGRDPRTPADNPGPPYPVFREPRDGVPAPGEGKGAERDDDLVVGLIVAPGVPPQTHEDFFRTDAVQFRIRARNYPLAETFERSLREAFHDRMNWLMGPLDADPGERIIHSRIYTDMQRLGSGPEGHTFVCAYTFARYFPALTE